MAILSFQCSSSAVGPMSSASFLIYRKRKGTFSKEGLNERSLSHKMTPFDVGNNFVTKTKKKKKRERRLSVSTASSILVGASL